MNLGFSRWLILVMIGILPIAHSAQAGERVCQIDICIIIEDIGDPENVQFYVDEVTLSSVKFNLRQGNSQFEIRSGQPVSIARNSTAGIQRCKKAALDLSSTCSGWVSFTFTPPAAPIDPYKAAYCESYAKTAIETVAKAQQGNCGFGGPRWSPDFALHQGWCLGHADQQQMEQAAGAETSARASELQTCTSGLGSVLTKDKLGKYKDQVFVPGTGGGATAPAPAPVEPAAPAGYRLDCAGGGDMTARSSGDGFLRVQFDPGQMGSAEALPGEGECTWVDRGFRPGEPLMLVMASGDQDAAALKKRAKSGGRFSVTAYNNNQGAMVVTSVTLGPVGDTADGADEAPAAGDEALRITCMAGPTMKVSAGAGGSLRIQFKHHRKSSAEEEPFFGTCAPEERRFTQDDPNILLIPAGKHIKALKQRLQDTGLFVALATDTGEGAFRASRIDVPDDGGAVADAMPAGSTDEGGAGLSGEGGGGVTCFSGHTFHTGGPRKGKTFNTELCIDWSRDHCKFVGKSITRQSVTECTPGETITAKVFYRNGKSVIWDMALDGDSGKLVGNWSQNDGARGEWVTH